MLTRKSLYRAFSGLTNRYGNNGDKDNDVEVIHVSEMQIQEHPSECLNYQTMFLRASEEGGENELVFFRRLDDEFNKVINFYRSKVDKL